jgi:hypothetical protein
MSNSGIELRPTPRLPHAGNHWHSTKLKHAPASLAALFLNLIPIFGVGGAYVLLGERLTIAQSGGALLILVAFASTSSYSMLPLPV